jgi:outer membrane protein TolC
MFGVLRPVTHLHPVLLCLLFLVSSIRAQQQPMTLEQCMDYALEHSRDLAQLRITLDNQQLTTKISRGKYRPILSLSGDQQGGDDGTSASASLKQELPAGFTVTASGSADEGQGDNADSRKLSLSISKVLLGGGSWSESMLEIDNSLLSELVERNRLHRYERELAYRVKQNYYLLIRNHQTLRINVLRLERARKNLEHALERQRPLDIATARIEVPDNEAGVLRAKRQIESAEDNLKILIGMDVEEETAFDATFAFAERPIDIRADIAFGVTNHEDIINAGLQKQQLENEWPVQRAKRWPKLTASAGSARTDRDGSDVEDDTDATFGLALSWEPGGYTERLKARRIAWNIDSKEIDIEDLRQEKAKDIRDLGRRIRETLQLVRLQEQKIQVAEQRSELYADRWQNGEIDILEYVRSQNDLENSRIQLINLQTTYMELLGEYDFTVGR